MLGLTRQVIVDIDLAAKPQNPSGWAVWKNKSVARATKDWGKIQTILAHIGLEGDVRVRTLASHEIDAVTAALTAYLHLKNQTEALGDEEEGCMIIPEKRDWRTIKL